ncbi:hypothetical protein J2848_005918 [Azospirillum lipoferum]|uniref:Uncharacterized protein n=1 Tax=Azospirillum lipoferum TaxID=193 RepID=A0A5A9GGW2_AZOLI|nr:MULTISPECIES: hypothetical protein [Azospirillum]KAA0593738.1 hypothetical protein FZ942_22880 [Azospirillum lipoferum]MCP1614215.1 hypothetical protein [Azospirillum lipoferum]MDW5536900.1 hypothetical protein [Azospirillum sp. NL1]
MTSALHHALVVWGRAFTDVFLRYVLPSHLSPGNLPALAGNERSTYNIYTTARDAAVMARSEPVRKLQRLMDVRFHVMKTEDEALLSAENVYDVMSAFHREAILMAEAEDARIVFLAPDALFSDGSFAAMERKAAEGCDCLLITAICTVMEDMQPWLEERVRGPGPVSFPASDLAGRAIRHMHPIGRSMIWGGERFNRAWASQFFWPVGSSGLLAHCWHLHPLMVRPGARSKGFTQTVDGDFVEALAGTRMHIIRDSDEICVAELSPRNRRDDSLRDLGPFDRSRFLGWARQWLRPVHAGLVRTPILFHDDPVDPNVLAPVQAAASRIVGSLAAEVEDLWPRLPTVRATGELKDAARIFIYGSGAAGQAVRERMERDGIAVAGFLDSHRAGQAHGLPVLQATSYATQQKEGDSVLVVSQYAREIEKTIRSLGIRNCFDGYRLFLGMSERSPVAVSLQSWEIPHDDPQDGLKAWTADGEGHSPASRRLEAD